MLVKATFMRAFSIAEIFTEVQDSIPASLTSYSEGS
jgi:hypothetical protein